MHTELKRRLLLIMNPGKAGVNLVPSVPSVIERYKNYFKSPAGGFWQNDEILELSRFAPNGMCLYNELAEKMKELNKADVQYSVIVFVGHGAAANGIDSIQTEDGKIYQLKEFCIPTEENKEFKRLIIVDACRSFAPIQPNQLILEEKSFSAFGTLNGDVCRDYYNELIKNTQPHVSIIQSTQHGQPACGTTTGTAFSDAVLNHLKRVSDFYRNAKNAPGTDHIDMDFPKILRAVNRQIAAYSQTPQFSTNIQNCNTFFPFFTIQSTREKRLECSGEIIGIINE